MKEGISPAAASFGESLGWLQSESEAKNPLLQPTVPKEFWSLAEAVAHSNHDQKWSLLYRLAYRLNHENKNLLRISVDSDVRQAQVLRKSVSRDIHKMHAFVRFKRVVKNDLETYVAWHKPEHPCLRLAAPFFVRRFGDKPWSIYTPHESAHWDGSQLHFAQGLPQNQFEHSDAFDEVWKTYYRSIFNPARIKIKAMNAEMPSKYWSSMPEAEIIRELVREAPSRLQAMAAAPKYLAEPPEGASWHELKQAGLKCTACPLSSVGTQTVFGEGPLLADIMIVGEQPGDEEDLSGRAFVGPAGRLLDEALAQAGLNRSQMYLTNAVKHFKFERQGKARIHRRASGVEQHACRPWLEAEIASVKPKVILALGVTAATALYGRAVKVREEREKLTTYRSSNIQLVVSWHPAAILRSGSEKERVERFTELVNDLRRCFELSREARAQEQYHSIR